MFCQIFKESLWWCTEANTETMSKYLWTYSNCICTIYKFHYTLLCILNLIRPPFHVLLVLSLLLHHLPLIIVIVFGVIIVGASCIWWPAFLLWSDVLVASYLQSPVFFLSLFVFTSARILCSEHPEVKAFFLPSLVSLMFVIPELRSPNTHFNYSTTHISVSVSDLGKLHFFFAVVLFHCHV